jgi:hypothetical protein
MSVAHRFIKGLEYEIGVPNAFGSEELEDEPDECTDPEEELEDESNIPEGYDDNGFIN